MCSGRYGPRPRTFSFNATTLLAPPQRCMEDLHWQLVGASESTRFQEPRQCRSGKRDVVHGQISPLDSRPSTMRSSAQPISFFLSGPVQLRVAPSEKKPNMYCVVRMHASLSVYDSYAQPYRPFLWMKVAEHPPVNLKTKNHGPWSQKS